MIADLGTKPIGGQPLDHLKVLMNMKALKEDANKEDADEEDAEKEDEEKKEDKTIRSQDKDQEGQMRTQVKAVKALGAIVLAAQIGQVRAQGDDDQGGIDWLIVHVPGGNHHFVCEMVALSRKWAWRRSFGRRRLLEDAKQ